MISRRDFLKLSAAAAAALVARPKIRFVNAANIPGGTLEPGAVPKYVTALVIPPAMARVGRIKARGGKQADYYEIAVQQFNAQILPAGFQPTPVFGYGSARHPGTFNYPAFTIEAKTNTPVRVKWINGLTDAQGGYLPHILPVDQTLHWANPPGPMPDMATSDPAPYTGPVPIVTHVHGAHVTPESDGYPEAWWLPAANNLDGFIPRGSNFGQIAGQPLMDGEAVFQYRNDQRATAMWFHDHTLGATRLNVYAGMAGFFLLRGGKTDLPQGALPGPAPALGDPAGTQYYEIPLAVQDKSFNADGSLFYPSSRAFFDGFEGPYIGDPEQESDISPIWNPEFFANMMLVNGKTWPVLTVEPRRYRFRVLNGCNSRFLILKLVSALTTDPDSGQSVPDQNATAALPFWQVGNEGGFLAAPVLLDQLLMAPAERADVVVDFTGLPQGSELYLVNLGPDEPFGGGVPGEDFVMSDPASTGQVMKFVVGPLLSTDTSLDPAALKLPKIAAPKKAARTVKLSLNEEDSAVLAGVGPRAALLGTVVESSDAESGLTLYHGMPMPWHHEITETPLLKTTEIWELFNFTMDAHPIHLHLVHFQVINREAMMMTEAGHILTGVTMPPEPWENGFKETVIAYPDQVTRVIAKFDIPGLYVWHCHIVEHEDNEMMRAFFVKAKPGTVVPPP